MMNKTNISTKITIFQLAMITVAYIASIRTVAIMAKYGLSSLFYYFAGALLFLLPTALVSAELSTMFQSKGGIYTWVSEAIPGPYGFVSIWIQFIIDTLAMPVIMLFLAASSTYIFDSSLSENKLYTFIFIIIVTWGNILVASFGMKTSAIACFLGNIFGLFIPIISLVALTFIWILSGNPINTSISFKSLFPDLSNLKNIAFLVGLLLSYAGIETSASHISDLKDPKKYYKAILLATIIIPSIGIGALAISIIIPYNKISLVSSVMEAFKVILKNFNLSFLVPLIAFSLVFGIITACNSSIIGPPKGLLGSSKGGEIPPVFYKQNKYGMPVNIFFFQGIFVTVIAALILLLPTVNAAYLLILDSMAFIYMIMYILMFASGIILRHKKPDIARPFKVPGGNIGMWIISGIGIFSCLSTIIFTFIPPPETDFIQAIKYRLISLLCEIFIVGIGVIIYFCRKPQWINKDII